MIVSHHPKEDRSIKALAVVMVALVAVLTTVRACQAVSPGGNWLGPFAAFSPAERRIVEDHFSRVRYLRGKPDQTYPG